MYAIYIAAKKHTVNLDDFNSGLVTNELLDMPEKSEVIITIENFQNGSVDIKFGAFYSCNIPTLKGDNVKEEFAKRFPGSHIIAYRVCNKFDAQTSLLKLSNYIDQCLSVECPSYTDLANRILATMIYYLLPEHKRDKCPKDILTLLHGIKYTSILRDSSGINLTGFDDTQLDDTIQEATTNKEDAMNDKSMHACKIIKGFPKEDCIKQVMTPKGMSHLHYLSGYERESRFIFLESYKECLAKPNYHVNLVYYAGRGGGIAKNIATKHRQYNECGTSNHIACGYVAAFNEIEDKTANGFTQCYNTLVITSLAVDPRYRRHRIASSLLECLKNIGVKVMCDVPEENLEAQLLLKQSGFSCVKQYSIETEWQSGPEPADKPSKKSASKQLDEELFTKESMSAVLSYDIPRCKMLHFVHEP